MKVLGIESSADDTGVALIEAQGEFGPDFKFKVLANEINSQKVHAGYGGIYPNLAKNEHARALPILIEKVLGGGQKVDAIAVTVGPGLEPCLWTGINAAQELAAKLGVPIVPVNHMEGHIFISLMRGEELASFEFPIVALLISGGHTELIGVKKFGSYEYLGRTRDDAVGEAFDKVARMLGLPYPGGPHISRLAEEARQGNLKRRVELPRPMLHESNLDFSFAGLKTAVLRQTEGRELSEDDKRDLAREFEDAATDVLLGKTLRAVESYGANAVVMGGGVSANSHIRANFEKELSAQGCNFLVCPPKFSTDNGLMIAIPGYFHALKSPPAGGFADPASLRADGNLKLDRSVIQ